MRLCIKQVNSSGIHALLIHLVYQLMSRKMNESLFICQIKTSRVFLLYTCIFSLYFLSFTHFFARKMLKSSSSRKLKVALFNSQLAMFSSQCSIWCNVAVEWAVLFLFFLLLFYESFFHSTRVSEWMYHFVFYIYKKELSTLFSSLYFICVRGVLAEVYF